MIFFSPITNFFNFHCYLLALLFFFCNRKEVCNVLYSKKKGQQQPLFEELDIQILMQILILQIWQLMAIIRIDNRKTRLRLNSLRQSYLILSLNFTYYINLAIFLHYPLLNLIIFYKDSIMQAQPDQIRLCQKGPDHNKDIIMVCLNPECDAIRLCCLTCVDQFHRKHQLVSLHKFQQMLSQLSDKQRPEAKLPIIQVIQQYKKSLHDQLQQLLKRMINEFRETQKQLDSVFKNVFDLLQTPTANISIIQDFYQNFNSKCAQKYLKKIKDSNNINFASQKMITQITQRAQVCFKKGLLDFEKLYSKNLQQIKKGIIIIKKSLLQDKFVPWTKKFSKTNKAACLALDQNDMKTKRFQGAGGYPINLIEQPLTKQNNSVSFKITEQPGNKGIWMGVCAIQIVKSFNFLSCYGIGKGTWAIDQVGQNHQSAYSWNHHDTNFNSQPKVGWQFNLGDTVTISVNFDKSTVSFNRGLDKYQQPIKLDLGQIYAFAGPTNLGDSIILV